MVERQLPKLHTWVRFPSPAPLIPLIVSPLMSNRVRDGLLAVVVTLALAGCGRQEPPLSRMSELQMPPDDFAGVTHVEVYGNSDDLAGETGSEAVGAALQRLKIVGAAQYRYLSIEPAGTTFRVKVDLFTSEADAKEAFRGRHLPEALAMTESLPLGDDGFIVESIYAGVRSGRVTIEVRAVPPDARLRPFVTAYAAFLADIRAGKR